MSTSSTVDGRAPIHTFYSPSAWIEGNATRQLEDVAKLEGVTAVAAMPDLHVGKYGPVGIAVLADVIHPQLVGSDIGCGMALHRLDVPLRKLRLDQAAARLAVLEGQSERHQQMALPALTNAGMADCIFNSAIGTVGGGNHFCEVQAVEDIVDEAATKAAGLDRDRAVVLVHSGSRGFGYSILADHLRDGLPVLDPSSEAGRVYLAAHHNAITWARINRRMIAARAAEALRGDETEVVECSHNFAEVTANGVLHRKGAAPSDRGLVPIPGSRGTLSYLVEPIVMEQSEALASLAHGAGRKYDRGSMHGRVRSNKSELVRLARNPYGGYVVCEDRDLLIEEAPEAYKGIDRVIGDLVDFGLARVVATFRPLVTFKTARAPERQDSKPRREKRERREDWR